MPKPSKKITREYAKRLSKLPETEKQKELDTLSTRELVNLFHLLLSL
jgi:hypothetical protein